MKEQKRLASINLTEDGYQAMITIGKKTKQSRRELVSEALVEKLHGTLSAPFIKFKFFEPMLLVELRKDIVALEAAAEEIRRGLYSVRPRDFKQAQEISKQIAKIQQWLEYLEKVSTTLQEKHRLLDGLTVKDYKEIGKLIRWCESQKKASEGMPDKAERILLFDLIQRLATLAR